MVAIGVRPNSRLAEEMGIEPGPIGAIAIDEHLCTNASSPPKSCIEGGEKRWHLL